MRDRLVKLREKYERFRRGEEDVLAVKDEARLLLKEAQKKGRTEILEEVEDMLVDLELSAEESKCKCHQRRTC